MKWNGVRIFILDIGGSYRKLCDLLGYQYISLSLQSPHRINCFDLEKSAKLPSSQKIKFLVLLVELITKEEGDPRLPKLIRAELESAIRETFNRFPEPSFSALKRVLEENEEPAICRFEKILEPWCGDTPYGRLLDGETNIKLDSPVVAFDFKGLENAPDLQSVYLHICTDFIRNKIQSFQNVASWTVMDEFWRYLSDPVGAALAEEFVRTLRKSLGGVIFITQNIDDIAKSSISGAILSNTSMKWILRQKGADQNRLKEVLQLNDAEMALVSSLHQKRGLYSEALLIAEDKKSVVAIESSGVEYWIATSDARDNALIEQRKENQKPIFETLESLHQEYPRGVAGSVGASE